MEVRVIRPQDNEDLIKLSRLTPMEGSISVHIERSPDYLRFYNLHGIHGEKLTMEERLNREIDVWNALVAEEDGQTIGVMSTSGELLLYDGKPTRVGYLMDARVHPDHRRKGVVRSIGFKFVEEYSYYPIDCILGYIIRGNKRAVKGITEGGSKYFSGSRGGTFDLYQISMYRPYFGVKGLPVERATAADKDEIIELLREFYDGYNFAPIINDKRWERMMEVSLGYSYDDIRLVREGGRIVALLGLWDQAQIRQTVVLKNKAVVRLGIALAHVLRLFFRAPRPPVEGKPMRSLYIKHIACRPGYEHLLKKMLKQATNEVRRACTHHFIWGAFFETDPLRLLFRGLTKTEVKSDMFWGPWNTGWKTDEETFRKKPAFADFSLV